MHMHGGGAHCQRGLPARLPRSAAPRARGSTAAPPTAQMQSCLSPSCSWTCKGNKHRCSSDCRWAQMACCLIHQSLPLQCLPPERAHEDGDDDWDADAYHGTQRLGQPAHKRAQHQVGCPSNCAGGAHSPSPSHLNSLMLHILSNARYTTSSRSSQPCRYGDD